MSIITPKTTVTFLKRFARDTQGSFAVMMGFVFLALFAAVGLAIDAHNLYKTKQELQSSLDAATLMIAKARLSDQSEMEAIVEEYLATRPQLAGVTVDSVTRDGNNYSASASLTKDTLFMYTVGIPDAEVAAATSTTFDIRGLNIALVLDSTGSMRGSKMSTLKSAAGDLIDQLDALDSDVVQMSVVPFARYVNVGTTNMSAPWLDLPGSLRSSWEGCVGSLRAPLHLNADMGTNRVLAVDDSHCPSALQPLTNNLNNARQAVNNMNADGWTYIPSGISWGWRTLTTQQPLPAGANGASAGADNVMIVMTDGANTRSKSGLTHDTRNGNNANVVTARMCTNAKADGIIIYTISYEITDTVTRDMMQACASSAAHNFNADSAAELRSAFAQINQSVLSLRLTN